MSGFKYVRVLNIRKLCFVWQGSEYLLGCNYRRVLNITRFRVCQVSAYASVAQGSEYAWKWLNNTLWQSSEYAWSTFHMVLDKALQVCETSRHFRPKLVHWNKSVYCTPIDRALKMQFNKRTRGLGQHSTTNHSWVMEFF